MSQPIKPSKKSIPRDSIFANFGMIGAQPYTRDYEPERVQQEQQAGLVPVKTGGARRRKKTTKVKRGGAKKKRLRAPARVNKRR
jgi:hypothetical protein